MLNKLESKVMKTLFLECENKKTILITPNDLIKITGDKLLTESVVDKIVCDLSADGYLDLIYSDRHGEKVYCITLTEKGKGFLRGKKVMKRTLIFRLMVTVVLAVVSFVIGLVLKAIF